MSNLPTRSLSLSTALALGVLALPACRAPDPRSVDNVPVAETTPAPADDAEAEAVMRAYEAPPGRAQELASVLHKVLRGHDEQAGIGRVTAMDGDRVVVVAPPGIHTGVEQLCQQLSERRPDDTARTVEISYWLVEAAPSDATDTTAIPELSDALAAIAAERGPTRFSLYERAQLASMLNAEGKSSGARAEFQQVAAAHEGGVVADLEIELRPLPSRDFAFQGRLETRIAVQPGKTVVIGSNGGTGDDTRLLYVMRAELVDA